MIEDKYQELCDKVLSLAENDEIRSKMEAVLNEGKLGDFSVNTGLMKNNPSLESRKRMGYAYMLASNPNTFEEVTKNNINLFHGTNSNALFNILKYGMMSLKEQNENGVTNTTGETWSRIKDNPRSFVSLTDDFDVAMDYASANPNTGNSQIESFGIIIGTSTDDLSNLKQCHIHSDCPEIGIENGISLENIKCILAQEDYVEFVRKLVENKDIQVLPIKINEKYYSMTDLYDIGFDNDMFEDFKFSNSKKEFKIQETSDMAKSRRSLGIKGAFSKLKEVITKERGIEKDGADSRYM